MGTTKRIFSKSSITVIALSILPLVGCNSDGVDYSSYHDLFDPNQCLSTNASLVGLSDTSIGIVGNANVGGNVVLMGASSLQATGNAQIAGKIHRSANSSISVVGNATHGGIVDRDFTEVEPVLHDVVNQLNALEPTANLYSINSSLIISGGGGVNVVRIAGGINLSGQSELIFEGSEDDLFLIQVAKDVEFSGKASTKLVGGVSPRNLIFILNGADALLKISGQGVIHGSFYVGYGAGAQISGKGMLFGSVMARNSIQVTGNGVTLNPAPFCPNQWFPPQPDPSESPNPDPSQSPNPDPSPSVTPDPSPSVTPDPSPTSGPGCTDNCGDGGGIIGA